MSEVKQGGERLVVPTCEVFGSKIYIAGPMRGIPHFNAEAFNWAAEALKKKEWTVVINPVDLDRECFGLDVTELPEDWNWQSVPDGIDVQELLRNDLMELMKCDAIYLLEGWEHSHGAKLEKQTAEAVGIEVFYQKPLESAGLVFSDTGACRNSEEGKLDFDWLSIPVLKRITAYMNANAILPDGSRRSSDNWKQGMPRLRYRRSAQRHFYDWLESHQNGVLDQDMACATIFNIMGDLHEELKGIPIDKG